MSPTYEQVENFPDSFGSRVMRLYAEAAPCMLILNFNMPSSFIDYISVLIYVYIAFRIFLYIFLTKFILFSLIMCLFHQFYTSV